MGKSTKLRNCFVLIEKKKTMLGMKPSEPYLNIQNFNCDISTSWFKVLPIA